MMAPGEFAKTRGWHPGLGHDDHNRTPVHRGVHRPDLLKIMRPLKLPLDERNETRKGNGTRRNSSGGMEELGGRRG